MQTITKRLEPAFWTARQCADYLGCSVGAIWLWKRLGKLPFYAQGRVVRFKREDIDRLMTHRPVRAAKKAIQ